MPLKNVSAALAAVALAGCATVPDVTLRYYPVKWEASLSVTQSFLCDADGTPHWSTPASTLTPVYSADRRDEKALRVLRIKSLDAWYGDLELTVGLTDDGRLRSLNESGQGQGEAIVKSFAGLATTLGALSAGGAAAAPLAALAAPPLGLRATKAKTLCELLSLWSPNKPFSVTYRGRLDESSVGRAVPLMPDHSLAEMADPKLFPAYTAQLSLADAYPPAEPYQAADDDGVVLLKLQKTALARVKVTSDKGDADEVRMTVPLAGTYDLPIPKVAFFGGRNFSVALADSGALTSFSYKKTSGAAAAAGALDALAKTETPATKAAALKAEIELIAAQQKLLLCQTKPADCK